MKGQGLKTGCLIVFEGIDGAGKTTQIELLYDRLTRDGYQAIKLKEPTNGQWGQKIRGLLERGRAGISRETEQEWFLSDRRENVEDNIRPALARRQIILMDRYYFSTMAYQGALGLDTQSIQEQNEAFAPPPNLMFLLQMTPDASLKRVQQRSTPDQFEKQSYLQQVAAIFDNMQFPYMRRIDATQSPAIIHQQIWEGVEPLLRRLAANSDHEG